jgi:hypothetical protein
MTNDKNKKNKKRAVTQVRTAVRAGCVVMQATAAGKAVGGKALGTACGALCW